MTYAELDINQKINVKAALQAWATYSVEHFQAELDKKVYGVKTTKSGYKYARVKQVLGNLRKSWWHTVQAGSGVDRVMIEFLLYGRFVDMGVGRGTSHTSRVVNRQLKLGRSPRVRKPWYSKRKSYEIKRLREILAEQNINLMVDSIESALNIRLNLNV